MKNIALSLSLLFILGSSLNVSNNPVHRNKKPTKSTGLTFVINQ